MKAILSWLSHDDSARRRSNVEALAFAKNETNKVHPKKKSKSGRYSVNALSTKVTETFRNSFGMVSSSKGSLDISERAMTTAKDCIQLLKLYKHRYLKTARSEHDQLRETHKNHSTICDCIDALGAITFHMQIHLRQQIFDISIGKSIQDAQYQYILRKNQIENANNNNLLTDVLDDFFKTLRQNKDGKNILGFRSQRSSTFYMSEDLENLPNLSNAAPTNVKDIQDTWEQEGNQLFRSNVLQENFLELDALLMKLHRLDTWDDVNIFEVNEISDGYTLLLYLPIMLERFGFIDDLEDQKLEICSDANANENINNKLCLDRRTVFEWLDRVTQEGYNKLPYHSVVHAADVLQTSFYWVTREDSKLLSTLTKEDIFAMLIAATIHDYQHPGVSHPYLIQADHTSRYIYNDIDVLENFHLCQAFKVMKQLDIFKYLNRQQKKTVHRNIVGCVLATNFGHQNELIYEMQNDKKYHDMSFDQDSSGQSGGKLKKKEIRKTRSILRPLLLHASDISHCCKKLEIHKEWSERYWREWHTEKEMLKSKGVIPTGVSRRDFPKEQVFFFELWCLPFYELLCDWLYFPETQTILKTGQDNYQYWKNGKGSR